LLLFFSSFIFDKGKVAFIYLFAYRAQNNSKLWTELDEIFRVDGAQTQ